MHSTSARDIRSHFRFGGKKGVVATLYSENNDTIKASVINLSRGGAYLRTSLPVPDTFNKVDFAMNDGSYTVSRICKIQYGRQDGSGNSCAIAFKDYLSNEDEDALCNRHSGSKSLDLVKTDFNVVNQEIDYARSSRVKIFMAIIGCLNTWLIGVVALGITNNLDTNIWLAIAASLPTILLAIGIFSNVMCVNFLNLRKAYLAVLTYYFRNEIIPPGYLGWSHLSINRYSCKNRIKQGLCQKKDEFCYQHDDGVTDKFSMFGDVVESIGKIIGLVYTFLFLLSSTILIVISFRYVNNALAFAIGGGSLFVFGYLYIITKSLSKGSRSIESYYKQWKKALVNCVPVLPDKE